MEQRLFEQIFSDAHVVDADLSGWDKSVDLYVLADHMPHVEHDRKPLFRVRFLRVRALRMDSSADNVEGLAPNEHVQWTLDDFRVEVRDGQLNVFLWGFEASPRLEIVCEDVEIQPFPLSVFDELFPGWDQPSAGLARPGPSTMAALRGNSNWSP